MGPSPVDDTATRSYAEKGSLFVGFLALAAGVLVAHGAPASRYEPSIYAATPEGFWAGVVVAAAVGLLVAVFGRDLLHRSAALLLSGGSVVAVAALPLLRGYTYYGTADALTHLGWTRDILAGDISAFAVFYPGLHTAGVVLGRTLGVPLTRSLLVLVLAFLVVFVLFVPLCVRELTDSESGLIVGTFAALLVLPVNHVAVHYMSPHPISEMVLFAPLVLFLVLRYLRTEAGFGVSRTGGLLALSLAATVVYHTMQAANLLVVLGAMSVVQFAYRRWAADDVELSGGRPLYGQTLFLAAAFTVWNLQYEVLRQTSELMIDAITGVGSGGAQPAAVVADRQESLAVLGAGLGEVFARLFFASTVVGLLAAGIVGYSFLRYRDPSLSRVRLLGVGTAALAVYSLSFFVGPVSRLFFRNLGFVMVLASVVGAVAIVRMLGTGPYERVPTTSRAAVALLFAILLTTSMVVVFPSPYIFHSNRQVTDAQLSGYQTAFEVQDPDVPFRGIRNGPQRYLQAVYGRTAIPEKKRDFWYYRQQGRVSGEGLTALPSSVDGDRYLIVTEHDRLRETEGYRGLRYTAGQFDTVDSQPGVGRVVTNGGFEMYYVTARGNASAASVGDATPSAVATPPTVATPA